MIDPERLKRSVDNTIATARHMAEAFLAVAAVLRNALWDIYQSEGAPYGDTDEGFQRWLDERNEEEEGNNGTDDEHPNE